MTAYAWPSTDLALTDRNLHDNLCAQRVSGGLWMIRFPSRERAWELEFPAHATHSLPVRVRLGETGSRRGAEASALVSWVVYKDAVGTLTDESLDVTARTREALVALLSSAFSPLVEALDDRA